MLLVLRAVVTRDRNGNRRVTVHTAKGGRRLNGQLLPWRLSRQVEPNERNSDAAENAAVELLADRFLYLPDYCRRGLYETEGPDIPGKLMGVTGFWFTFRD